jgi:hypothetical protein
MKQSRILNKNPYLQVVDMPRMMGGVGAPRSTVFGVLGRTKMDPYTRSLGGLVQTTTPGVKSKAAEPASSVEQNTERNMVGPKSKTPMPGDHYGQVPYPGAFQSHLGARV